MMTANMPHRPSFTATPTRKPRSIDRCSPSPHYVRHHRADNTWWVIETGNSVTGLRFVDRAWAQSAADDLNKGVPAGVYAAEPLPSAFSDAGMIALPS